VLEGEAGPAGDITCANAGAAIWIAGASDDYAGGIALAQQSIESGAARERLDRLVASTNAIEA